ncbi:hypothetical protein BZA05DRAFT_401545 [Tricharina praecox]|uniref:uncharacterized protein n=1 Tax=Tricharina praecox TaxID=43433 RepID=UPI0022201716|nr:uncharacterized protein BZA05DRAFT_401545 [Tricharina praecox]KAI5849785.1 hypothetical protein BZA05DRAFT_401545 [Tricharina praecox]
MPPQIHSSDEESDDDVILPKKTDVASDESDDEVAAKDGSEDEGSDVDEADNLYTVHSILDHKFVGSKLFFHVKWVDYPLKKDWTWEPEEHLTGGSDVILQDYYKSIGGRPKQQMSAVRKRGRQSVGASAAGTPAKSAKKPRTSVTASLASPVGSFRAESPDEEKDTRKQTKGDKWKPPAGNWEDVISHIDTIEKTDAGLVCYVQWSNGRKSQHDVSVVYKKCPQRMLTFYEQHLVFKETGML